MCTTSPTPKAPRPQKVYVTVDASFDSTGYMQPCSITWPDGRSFPIESVKDFRPAGMLGTGLPGDCYTVIIHGQERYLFFERTDSFFSSRFGRWFVEKKAR